MQNTPDPNLAGAVMCDFPSSMNTMRILSMTTADLDIGEDAFIMQDPSEDEVKRLAAKSCLGSEDTMAGTQKELASLKNFDVFDVVRY